MPQKPAGGTSFCILITVDSIPWTCLLDSLCLTNLSQRPELSNPPFLAPRRKASHQNAREGPHTCTLIDFYRDMRAQSW